MGKITDHLVADWQVVLESSLIEVSALPRSSLSEDKTHLASAGFSVLRRFLRGGYGATLRLR